MSSTPTSSTQDLRSTSQDSKRDMELKHKWVHGEAWGVGRQATAHARPARVVPKMRQTNKELGVHQAKLAQRRDIIEEKYASADSSCDEDVVEPSAAPEPDAEIAYSYDATRGPSQGSQILGIALAKAVERFENNATDKLVKEEYEVLNSDGEPVLNKGLKKGSKPLASKDDDEYEFV